MDCRKIPQGKNSAAAGKLPQLSSWDFSVTGSWGPNTNSPGLMHGHAVPSGLPKMVTKNAGLPACWNKSQSCEIGTATKVKRFTQGTWPGRTVESHLKDHPPSLLKFSVGIRIWRTDFFFLSNYHARIGALKPYPLICSSFWHVRALSIHLSRFWHAEYKILSLHHLGQ